MRMHDIKDARDLKDMTMNDVIDVLDELKAVARKRGTEWLGRGRVEARKAIGAPDDGAVATAFLVGILVGAAAAAVATMLLSPVTAPEARRKLTEQVDRVRERVPEIRVPRMPGNGEAVYEREEHDQMGSAGRSTPTV